MTELLKQGFSAMQLTVSEEQIAQQIGRASCRERV